ncbi:MAG: hypothetical protein H6653_16355, partial [Ardenticatenaceae bacterium]|nr:hypothetical protein [Ardenticatenaceae bacterium]
MTDLDVIKELEQILDRKLFAKPFDPDKLWNKKAYCLNQEEQVIHVGLPQCSLRQLDNIVPILERLTSLQSLNLRNNQISDI